ncbi:SixA phosphatase family protein [Geodermatophilus sp. SYSU D00742]
MSPHRLLLIRHAQAGSAPVDSERPLTAHGLRQAAALGAWLERAGLVPDAVLVSPARRAVQTWEQAGGVLAPEVRPDVDPRVHDNTVEALLTAVREVPDDVRTLAVVGHNPSVGQLVGLLDDGQGSPVARREAQAGFPAGGVAVFDLAVPFAAIAPGTATLSDFTRPGD